jgi:integrase/recombinase XerC
MTEPTEIVVVEPGAVASKHGLDRLWVSELVEDWLSTVAESTRAAYRADFSDFSRWLVGDPDDHAGALKELFELGEANAHRKVLAYKAAMMKRPIWRSRKAREAGEDPIRTGLASRTINRRLAALKSVVRLARLGWRLDVRGTKVESIKDTSGVPRETFLAMLRALEAEAADALKAEHTGHFLRAMRDTCILRLWHDMGLRRSSVQRLDVEDVDLRRQVLRVYLKGKGDETKDKPVPAPTRAVLKAYLTARGREPGPLFYSLSNRAYGARIGKTAYNKILTRIAQLAGVDGTNPHKFRHTAITRALDKGASIRDVQAFSDHADVRTVMLYDDRRGVTSRRVAELVAEDDEDDA